MPKTQIGAESARCNSNVYEMWRYRRPKLSSPREPSSMFEILYFRALEAREFYKYNGAVRLRKLAEGLPVVEGDHSAFQDFVAATVELALFPVETAREIRMKKSAIGTMWLKSEGAQYDKYRECVARDEAALAALKKLKRES